MRSGKGLTLNSIFRIGLALGLFLLPALPAEAEYLPDADRELCEARVSKRLDRLNVDHSDIRGIFFDAQRDAGGKHNRVVRILAWVNLHSCEGYVIVKLSPLCNVRQVYGRGECNMGGAVKPW